MGWSQMIVSKQKRLITLARTNHWAISHNLSKSSTSPFNPRSTPLLVGSPAGDQREGSGVDLPPKRSEKEGMGQRAEGRNMKKSATSEIQVVNTTNFPMWEPLTMVFTRLAAGQTA